MTEQKPRQYTERRGRSAEPTVKRKRSTQLEIAQPCLACRAAAHKACVSTTCPCAERGHEDTRDRR